MIFFHSNNHWRAKVAFLSVGIMAMIPLASSWDAMSGSVHEQEVDAVEETGAEQSVLKREIDELRKQIESLTGMVGNIGKKTESGAVLEEE